MTLKELSQLYYLNLEIKKDEKRIANITAEIEEDEKQLAELEENVSSLSSPQYDGMPKSLNVSNKVEKDVTRILEFEESIEHKKALRSDIILIIQKKQILCLAEKKKLECYIATIPDSLLRLIFTHRFIKCEAWREVSDNIDDIRTTEDSVKKMCYRYLNKQKY